MTLPMIDSGQVSANPTSQAPPEGGSVLAGSTSANPALKRTQVRQKLQDMILQGAWRPGSRLGQEELAGYFQAAQGLVREVFIELRASGLVECSDFRGAVVSRLDKQKLVEAYELREMHEAIAVRRCCERLSRAELNELMELPPRIYAAGKADKWELAACLDRELHGQLLERSDSSMLRRLAENYLLLCRVVRKGPGPTRARADHLSLLRAIADGDADKAERIIRQHIAAERNGAIKHLPP
jgi:DNA-binding GntR family transcriptional regulator